MFSIGLDPSSKSGAVSLIEVKGVGLPVVHFVSTYTMSDYSTLLCASANVRERLGNNTCVLSYEYTYNRMLYIAGFSVGVFYRENTPTEIIPCTPNQWRKKIYGDHILKADSRPDKDLPKKERSKVWKELALTYSREKMSGFPKKGGNDEAEACLIALYGASKYVDINR